MYVLHTYQLIVRVYVRWWTEKEAWVCSLWHSLFIHLFILCSSICSFVVHPYSICSFRCSSRTPYHPLSPLPSSVSFPLFQVQENCIDLVGRIADRGAEFVPAREWMRICFELLDMLKVRYDGVRKWMRKRFMNYSTCWRRGMRVIELRPAYVQFQAW